MKRSYTSFVNDSVNSIKHETHIPTSSHSFHQNATLATHYDTFGKRIYYSNPSPMHSRTYSSNPSCPPSLCNESGPIRRKAPLTGLGITFSDDLNNGSGLDPSALSSVSVPVSAPLRIPFSTYLSGNYSPFVNDSLAYTPHKLSPTQDDWRTSTLDASPFTATNTTHDPGAYSACPADEYLAPSPTQNYSPLLLASLSREAPLCLRTPCHPMDISPNSDAMMISPQPKAEPETPMIGLFADTNFREQGWMQIQPTATVDPSALTGNDIPMEEDLVPQVTQRSVAEQLGYSESPPSVSPSGSDAALDSAVTAIMSVLSASIVNERFAIAASLDGPANKKQKQRHYKNSQGLTVPAFAKRTIKREVCATPDLSSPNMTVLKGRATLGDITTVVNNAVPQGPVILGSPVLNAHAGISLEYLRRKADEYRTDNQCDIDKNWLQAFAGRLSEHGELLNEFRCYVNGCDQTNRRRDHILVHVGSHVEHRPFSCLIWYTVFLIQTRCFWLTCLTVECGSYETTNANDTPLATPAKNLSSAKSALQNGIVLSSVKIFSNVISRSHTKWVLPESLESG